mmetsp:Transcript_42878/g.91163  ORF Transcript_42878/g.91163 Transcript_42878/m.91163 type:complete len:202 (-) Transcript_42878:159-764(-)
MRLCDSKVCVAGQSSWTTSPCMKLGSSGREACCRRRAAALPRPLPSPFTLPASLDFASPPVLLPLSFFLGDGLRGTSTSTSAVRCPCWNRGCQTSPNSWSTGLSVEAPSSARPLKDVADRKSVPTRTPSAAQMSKSLRSVLLFLGKRSLRALLSEYAPLRGALAIAVPLVFLSQLAPLDWAPASDRDIGERLAPACLPPLM